MTITYKGYEIKPSPTQLAENNMWDICAVIEKNHGSHTNEIKCTDINTCKNENEAIEKSINYAKQIIDGHCKDYSVAIL